MSSPMPLPDVLGALMVARNCKRQEYRPVAVPRFDVAGEFIAYGSPESTYAATRKLLDAAKRSILIGIYDFTAPHMRDTLLRAMGRGVKVSLMLDLDGRKGEPEVWEALKNERCERVPAPSCASKYARYFASSHEKVIVVDDLWTLVQSGNYSDASIPENEVDGGDPQRFAPGNRDTGLAVRSEALAAFFTQILRSDMRLELDAEKARVLLEEVLPFEQAPELVALAAARPQVPPRRFASKRYRPRKAISVQPVLSPDNYMQIVPDWLASAKESVYIEQQYIKGKQPAVRKLLGAIRSAMDRNPDLVVRIVLGRLFESAADEAQSLQALADYGLEAGTHVRFLSSRYFVHCHDKLIIVDRRQALVSSQNWSDSAVLYNREAGLLIDYVPLVRYYTSIFGLDWETGDNPRAVPFTPAFAEAVSFEPGAQVPISLGDYVEV